MKIENIAAEALNKSIEEFVAQESIKVMKEQPKKGFALKEVDIKPMIEGMKLSESREAAHIIDCLLLSGSKGNLKPELLMMAFKEFTGYNIVGVKINREEVYAEKKDTIFDLLEYEI
jgi:hypothetical protein